MKFYQHRDDPYANALICEDCLADTMSDAIQETGLTEEEIRAEHQQVSADTDCTCYLCNRRQTATA